MGCILAVFVLVAVLMKLRSYFVRRGFGCYLAVIFA